MEPALSRKKGRPRRALLARCAGLCTLMALVAGCAGEGSSFWSGPDVGVGVDAGLPRTRIAVELRADDSVTRFPLALLGLAEVRAPNDRSSDLEPVEIDMGQVDLHADPRITLAPALPGYYGRLRLRLDAGAWGPALRLELSVEGTPVVVELSREIFVDQSCGAILTLETGHTLTMRLTFSLVCLEERLAAVPLPAPTDGVIYVTAMDAPEGASEVERWLYDDMPLECDVALTPVPAPPDAGLLDGAADAPADGGAADTATPDGGAPFDAMAPPDGAQSDGGAAGTDAGSSLDAGV